MTTRAWFRALRGESYRFSDQRDEVGVIFRTGYADVPHTRLIWLRGPVEYQDLIENGIAKHTSASAYSETYRSLRARHFWDQGRLVP